MEQNVWEWSLAEWLVLDKRMRIKLKGVSKIAERLGKMWTKYRDKFVPIKSPLMSFVNRPYFGVDKAGNRPLPLAKIGTW